MKHFQCPAYSKPWMKRSLTLLLLLLLLKAILALLWKEWACKLHEGEGTMLAVSQLCVKH